MPRTHTNPTTANAITELGLEPLAPTEDTPAQLPASLARLRSALLEAAQALTRYGLRTGRETETVIPEAASGTASPCEVALVRFWAAIREAISRGEELGEFSAKDLLPLVGSDEGDSNASYILSEDLPGVLYALRHADGILGAETIAGVEKAVQRQLDADSQEEEDEEDKPEEKPDPALLSLAIYLVRLHAVTKAGSRLAAQLDHLDPSDLARRWHCKEDEAVYLAEQIQPAVTFSAQAAACWVETNVDEGHLADTVAWVRRHGV